MNQKYYIERYRSELDRNRRTHRPKPCFHIFGHRVTQATVLTWAFIVLGFTALFGVALIGQLYAPDHIVTRSLMDGMQEIAGD